MGCIHTCSSIECPAVENCFFVSGKRGEFGGTAQGEKLKGSEEKIFSRVGEIGDLPVEWPKKTAFSAQLYGERAHVHVYVARSAAAPSPTVGQELLLPRRFFFANPSKTPPHCFEFSQSARESAENNAGLKLRRVKAIRRGSPEGKVPHFCHEKKGNLQ